MVWGKGSEIYRLIHIVIACNRITETFNRNTSCQLKVILIGTTGTSLKDPASTAYAQEFAPHHGWAIRKAVAAGTYVLPTRAQLMKKLNEDEASARIQMQNYIVLSAPVTLYIDKLFLSRELGVHW
ncbi:hypothetical protein HHK36_023299 [Tetracentron sinense]|uniref:Glycolipid transfer protein domain-containing protein n=1 Tax=Tetracentron sinense TaxID=13715 RepID=A0A834YL83_TETSI|nr:hypothetical protein HHK36_023299 [Tetracentron sinense]